MNYRREMEALIEELRTMENESKTLEHREKRRRQAEVLDFIIHHPDDALANLKSDD